VGVGAHARVPPVEGEDDARLLCDCGVDRLETRANFFERKRLAEKGFARKMETQVGPQKVKRDLSRFFV
jgi:hypothetical protein